jgi:uncharacterized protein YegP (UPF0339 family)
MEMSKEEVQKTLADFGIVYNSKNNLSQLGGLKILLEVLKRGRFRHRFEGLFGIFKARTVLQSLLGLWAGARTMVEIGQTGKDPLIEKFIGSVVEEAQLGRDFRSFSRAEIEVFDLVQKTPHTETLYFDVDATSVEKYGHQEGVDKGYVGKALPQSCYQYLLIYFNNRKTFLYGTIRDGSAHSQNDFCGYLRRFLPMLERRWNTVFRADSGYHNEKAFDLFSEHAATFFIKSPMSESRQNFVQTSTSLVWSSEKNGVSFSEHLTNTTTRTKFREIYKRTRIDNGGQMSLDEAGSYRFDCLSTNDFTIEESEAFATYNKRAHIENAIKELKEDYQLGRIVTDSFDANDVITQVTLLAYMLVQVIKNEVLPLKMSRMRLSTLRTQVFNIPACIVHWARRMITRIQNIFVPEHIMAMIIKKVRTFVSWVLDPPIFGIAN